jgi:large subunit ribosomal protein L43
MSMKNLVLKPSWLPKAYVKSVLQNGMGRYLCQLQRVTLLFDKARNDSAGVREFIQEDLLNFASKYPGIVVYLQPKRNKAPYVVAEFLNGREASVHISNFNRIEVNQWMNYLRTRSGEPIHELMHMWRTESPSIQGIWHPFLNRPKENIVKTFPDVEQGKFVETEISATENVIKLAKELENVRVVHESR